MSDLKRKVSKALSSYGKTLSKLRKMELPNSLSKLIQEDEGVIDTPRNTLDLYFSSPDVQKLFFEMRGFDFELDMWFDSVRALQELDSAEKVKGYILGELVGNESRFRLVDPRLSYGGSGIDELRKLTLSMARLDGLQPNQSSKLNDLVGHWDHAALDIITDPAMFHTKTINGNEGTISEYVGYMVLSNINVQSSPLAKDGRYVQQVIDAIRDEDIIQGRITIGDGLIFEHQKQLLVLLSELDHRSKVLSSDFWRPIERNEDFLDASRSAAVTYKFSNQDELLCKTLDWVWRHSQRDYWPIATQIVYDHFEEKGAYHRFKMNHKQEIADYFGINFDEESDEALGSLSEIRSPSDYEIKGRKVVVLLGYQKKGRIVEIDYAFVNKLKYGERRVEYRSGKEDGVFIEAGLKNTFFDLVKDFERFTRDYNVELQRRIKRSGSESSLA